MSKAFSIDERQPIKKTDDLDEERPGGLRYLEQLIRLKTAGDFITTIQQLVSEARTEVERIQVIVEMTSITTETATESTQTITTGVEAIAEANQVLDHLKTIEVKDKEKEADIEKITLAKQAVVSGIKEATESAKSAVETCQKYVGKESLAEFSVEGIKADLEKVKSLNGTAKEAHKKVISAHKIIKEIKVKRGIEDKREDIKESTSLKENRQPLDNYRAEALAFLEKETGISPKESQRIEVMARGQAQEANNLFARSEAELSRLESELKTALESAGEKLGTALNQKNTSNHFRLAP